MVHFVSLMKIFPSLRLWRYSPILSCKYFIILSLLFRTPVYLEYSNSSKKNFYRWYGNRVGFFSCMITYLHGHVSFLIFSPVICNIIFVIYSCKSYSWVLYSTPLAQFSILAWGSYCLNCCNFIVNLDICSNNFPYLVLLYECLNLHFLYFHTNFSIIL